MTEAGKAPLCPECGLSATGNFCAHCGAKLGGRHCDQCGASVGPGASYCNQCGASMSGGARSGAAEGGAGQRGATHRDAARAVVGGRNLPWWIAGAAMFVLIVVLGVSMVRSGPPEGPVASSAPGAATGAAAVDLSSMSPIEAATRLFNRVMTSVAGGDSASARAFLPMAIAAYDRARPLDHDGLYHLSVLQSVAGQLDAALDNATLILDEDPDHLLGLLASAHAAAELGLLDEAERHYRHLLEVYDGEVARALPEYQHHAGPVSSARGEAQAFLAGR